MADRIGYFGPGLMGRGIIQTLLAKGFPVTIFAHRDGLDLDDLVRAGGNVTRSLAEVAASSTVVLLTLPTSKEVEATVLGTPGLLEHLAPGSVVIDHSTSYPGSTRMLAEKLGSRRVAMLDAPMTGRPAQARSGELTLIVGGDRAAFERCQSIFQAIAKNIFHVGPVSHGNVIKIANNFLSQLGNAGVAEILPLVAKCGVDLKALYDVIRVSGGNSRAFEGAVPAIARGDFPVSFQLGLAHKDVSYASALGKEENVPLPMVNALLGVLDLAKATGLGGENVTALVKMWEKMAGVEARSEKFGK